MALGEPAPSFEPKDEIAEALEIASELCRLEDPVAEPYRSKYKARETLERAKRSLENGKATVRKECVSVRKMLWFPVDSFAAGMHDFFPRILKDFTISQNLRTCGIYPSFLENNKH